MDSFEKKNYALSNINGGGRSSVFLNSLFSIFFLTACLLLQTANMNAQTIDLTEGHTWDFTPTSDYSTARTKAVEAGFAQDGTYARWIPNTSVEKVCIDHSRFYGLLFTGSGSWPRLWLKSSQSNSVDLLNSNVYLLVPVVSGQKLTVTAVEISNDAGTILTLESLDNNYVSKKKETPNIQHNNDTQVDFTAVTNGYIKISNTSSSRQIQIKSMVLSAASKYSLLSYDYESEESVAPWSRDVNRTNAALDGSTSYYGAYTLGTNESGNRRNSLSWSIPGETDSYVIEFDLAFQWSTNNDRSGNLAEMALLTANEQTNNNDNYSGSNSLFLFKRKNTTDFKTWEIKTPNGAEKEITLDNNCWYHYKFIIDKTSNSLMYFITDGIGNSGTSVASGNTTIPSGVDATTLRNLISRNGNMKFDNFSIWMPTPEDGFVMFSKKTATANLIDLAFAEPMLYYSPENADITLTSSNTKIAVVSASTTNPAKHEVMFLNGGIVTIRAALTSDPTVYDEYTVTVSAPDATYEVTGTTYTLTGQGKLPERTVTMIPGITMEFGNASNTNTTIVRNEEVGLVATTLDNQAWRYARPLRNDAGTEFTSPFTLDQGTFYKFMPKLDGKLSVTGARANSGQTITNNDPTSVVLWDKTSNTTTNLIDTDGMQTASNISLVAGHEYYVYCPVPANENAASGWSMFQLHSFSYVTDFRYDVMSYVKKPNEFPVHQNLANASETGVTYSYEAKGNLVVDFNSADGTINSVSAPADLKEGDSMGGAIIVTATKNNYSVHYVVTVPYTTHKWDFYNVDLGGMDALFSETQDWGVTYKVRNYEDATRMLYYLNKPVLCNNVYVNGDNSIYIDETAGLVFTSSAKNFGANVVPTADPTPSQKLSEEVASKGEDYKLTAEYTEELDKALKEMLAYNKNEVKDPNVISTAYGNTITIPSLQKGQYLIMRVNRHSGNSGEHVVTTNLETLDGVDLNERIESGVDGNGNKTYARFGFTGILVNSSNAPTYGQGDIESGKIQGAYVFRVKEDGDVTIRVDDRNGWLDIYNMEITEVGKYDTEITLLTTDAVDYDLSNSGFVYRPGESLDITVRGGFTSAKYPRASNEQFIIESENVQIQGAVDGVLTSDMIYGGANDFTFKVTGGGPGTVKVTQKVFDSSGKFLVNLEETYLAVGVLEPQSYPYTWDLTDYNMNKSPSGSVYRNRKSKTGNTYGCWNAEDGNYIMASTVILDHGNMNKNKPLFASGSQLSVLQDAIVETKGLGIGLTNQVEEIGNKGIKLDGSKLRVSDVANGNPYIVIPEVPKDMYVFVKGTAPASVLGALPSSDYDVPEGVYLYKMNCAGSVGDVTLEYTTNAEIEVIGVTNYKKTINKYGFATESRNRAIDHTYAGKLTTQDVNAYYIPQANYVENDKVTGSSNDEIIAGTTSFTEADVVGENTGAILYKDNHYVANSSTSFDIPLFVPACNVEPTITATSDNLLKPNVDGSVIAGSGSDFVNYIFTNIAYNSGGQKVTDESVWQDIGFYRTNGGAMPMNTSYLQMAKSSAGAKPMILLMRFSGDDNGDTTGVSSALQDNGGADDESTAVYYNLNGQKLNGRPAQRGLYIRNGKKVFIK